MGLSSIFLWSEEITRFEDLNPIEIPFINLTYHHHTHEVESLQKDFHGTEDLGSGLFSKVSSYNTWQ